MKNMTGASDSKVLQNPVNFLSLRVFLCLVSVTMLVCGVFDNPANAQAPKGSTPELPSMGSAPGSSSATIGGTGFNVNIPEIRMNRIIGEPAPKKAPVEPRRGPVSSPKKESEIQPLHPDQAKEQLTRPGPIPMRLPFDSQYRKPPVEEVREVPPPKEEIKPEPAPVQIAPEVVDRPRLKFSPPKTRYRLPDPEEEPPTETQKEQIPETPIADKPQTSEKPRHEPHSPPFREPIAPVNITDSLPEPNKDIIIKRMIPLPHIYEVDAAKDNIKSLPVESQVFGQKGVEPDQIPMESRRAPLVVEIEEPQPLVPPKEEIVPQVKEHEAPQVKEHEEPKLTEPVKHQPMTPPETEQAFTVIPPKEQKPVVETKETKPETVVAPIIKEAPQHVEQPPAPPKEKIPSPLDEDSVITPELRKYLKETAPILEELSLLMARTPSLSIADFDPSDMQAPLIPKEINLKMESMKRELRILDSKIFSIIPPQGYAQYHDLIRQSINHTYMATEAFINFFNQSRVEDLNQVRENLAKAKEFIHRTTE